ncbi:MAG: DedA family protein [bacterium]
MEFIRSVISFLLHIDKQLLEIVSDYGTWTYGILFLVIFLETGLVITPFLPGDSLLFAAGALSAQGSLKLFFLWGLLLFAAIVGDNVNYWIGRKLGRKIPFKEDSRVLKKEYLDRTERFYEKYGTKAIIIARFVPIIRTITPFVAGLGKMNYRRFLPYDIVGGFLWVSLFIFGGYFFGNLSFVQDNFSLVVVAIILISLMPFIVEFFKHRKRKKAQNNLTNNQ